MARFVIAVSAVVFVVGASCGAGTKPDAGVMLTGGGLTGGTGGGAGGSSGTAGGSAGGMAGCTMVPSLPAANFFGAGFFPGDADAGDTLENFQTIGILDAVPDAGIGLFAFNELYWDLGTPRPTFPRPFTLAPETFAACYNCFRLLTCRLDLSACQNRGFMAQSGSGSWTAGTYDAVRGSFSGNASNVKYIEWDFAQGQDKAIDGGSCIQIANMTWNATWAPRDGGVDGG